jgi:uncharacterized membrane protein YqiK
MKYQPITYSLLVEKKACQSELNLVAKHFGKTKAIPLTKAASVFDIDWAAKNLLTKEDLAEYKKVVVLAFAEYDKVNTLAWAEYKKVTAQALAEYKKVNTLAWAEYQKVNAPAWAEYQKVRAQEFVRLYKKGMK